MDGVVEVHSTIQRVVVESDKVVRVVNSHRPIKISTPGPYGLPGPQGPQGPPGPPGQSAFQWSGDGPPGLIIGASPGEVYLDRVTGDLYTLV